MKLQELGRRLAADGVPLLVKNLAQLGNPVIKQIASTPPQVTTVTRNYQEGQKTPQGASRAYSVRVAAADILEDLSKGTAPPVVAEEQSHGPGALVPGVGGERNSLGDSARCMRGEEKQ